MSHIVNGKKIADIFSKGKPEALESEFDIEEVLSAVKSMRDKIEFYEALKKERSGAIQQEINKVTEKMNFLEKVILDTMDKVDKKSINYPGIAKVTKTTRKGKWVVNDSDEIVDHLKSTDIAAYNKVVSKKDVVSKRDLDSVLEMWEKTNQVPDCVEKTDPTTSLKVKFEDIRVDDADDDDSGQQNYDSLGF